MSTKGQGRRQFLKGGASRIDRRSRRRCRGADSEPGEDRRSAQNLHAYGERSQFETAIRVETGDMYPLAGLPPGARRDFGSRAPLQDTVGFITPASLHYVISHAHDRRSIRGSIA